MTAGFITLTSVVAAIVVALWLVWRARENERVRAEKAERSADRWRHLIESSDDVAHDVNGLLSSAFVNLESIADGVRSDPGLEPVDGQDGRGRAVADESDELVEEVSQALLSAIEMLRALRGDVEGRFEGVSTQGLVRLQAALHKARVPVDLRIEGDLPHGGHGDAAARVVGNLFENAVREASQAGGPVVVELHEDRLRVTNKVRDPSKLTEDIYARGVSGDGSTGRGLHIARELSARAGWQLSHEVKGDRVTFEVTRQRS